MVPSLSPEDRAKYFQSWTAVSQGSELLSGDRSRTIFEKANLPVEQLGDIWALTDRAERGALDSTEFIVAMHLIQSVMNGSLKIVPAQLPPALFEAAALAPPSARSQRQQSSISSVQSEQFSGARQAVPMRSQLTGPPQGVSPVLQQSAHMGPQRGQAPNQLQSPGIAQNSEWDVKPHEKANYDTLFNDIDKSAKGYATGEEAVTFFLQSKLPQDDLAQIWDLCTAWDNYSGELRKDWFAVAMHLIKSKLGGKDLPKIIPPSLIPPSERARVSQTIGSAYTAAPQASQSAPPVHSSAAADLFGLNDSFAAPPQSKSPPAPAFDDNFGTIDRFASPPAQSSTGNRSAPAGRGLGNQPAFVPSSSFGQSIQQQAPQAPPQQFSMTRQSDQDLLGDSNPQESRNINADSTEIANMRNQMSSLTTQQEQNNRNRSQAESDIENLKQEKASLTARLQQIRSTYDQEVKTVRALQVEQGSLRHETRELLKEVSLLDASLGAVQQQHDQINAQLQKDRADNIAIKERIKSANEQTITLKATLEKVQKDAKQQRGLVAINTKQLNTLEAGHEKLNTDIEDVQSRAAAEQAQYVEAQRIAAIEQERASANEDQRRSAMVSPALSTSSLSTNPFHRLGSPAVGQTPRSLLVQTSGPAFPFVQSASAGAVLAGVGSSAAAVAFGHQDGAVKQGQNEAHRPLPVNIEDDFSSSYGTAPTTAESRAPQSATLSGFDHAFPSDSGSQSAEHSSLTKVGLNQSPAFSELPVLQDAPKDTASPDFQTYKHNAPESDNEPRMGRTSAAEEIESQIVSPKPKPINPQAQSWSDADPFTSDPRAASPTLQSSGLKPLPSAVSKLAISSGASDTGSVSTSIQAQASASVRDVASESRPLTPASLTFGSETNSASKPVESMESATEEHELPRAVTPAIVQSTLTQAPRDEHFSLGGVPANSLSPSVPGAFPSDDAQQVPQEHLSGPSAQTFANTPFAPFDAPVSQNNNIATEASSSFGLMDQHVAASTQELESSDDETVEEPRRANMFANTISAAPASPDIETASTHTITREDGISPAPRTTAAPASDSFFGSFFTPRTNATDLQAQSAPTSAAAVDDFDEFDDLEEATEVDDDEEGDTSYTQDAFEPTFDAPSARSSIAPQNPINGVTAPVSLAQPGRTARQASPARDFSEFAHYGSVIAEPSGLAPPIQEDDFAPTTIYRGQAQAAPNPATFGQPQFAFSPPPIQSNPAVAAAPAPPVSRYGASLAPKRPEPARAISAADDPMLIELMDMGFDREKSVKALEDFNYDLGRATDFLLKGK